MNKYLLSAFAFAMATTATAMHRYVPQAPVTAPVEHVIQALAPDVESTLVSPARQAPRRIKTPVTKASDLVGSYSWSYKTAEDIAALREIGADAVLVGEALMKAADKKQKLNELRGRL